MHGTIYEIDNQQGPAVCTWNYTQHFIIIYKGKESEKVYICVYTHTHTHTHKLNHCAIHVKLIQKNIDCKYTHTSTILQ